jgi:hypothetical protein
MSLLYAEEDVGQPTPSDHAPTRVAAGLGVAAAVVFMLLCLASFVVGGSRPLPRSGGQGGAVGQFAHNFSLRDLEENRVTLSQYRGRPVLLLVSADPLPPDLLARACSLGSAHVVINVHESGSPASPTASGTGKAVVQLLDQHRVVSEDYELRDLPAALVISPDGLILESGPLSRTLARLSDD